MPIRTLLALALLLAAPASAQPNADAPLPHVLLKTELGTIEVELETKRAPLSAGSFLRYVDQRRLDGTVFYRVMRLPWGTPPNGLVQGGPRGDPKRVLRPIAHEPTDRTGLSHTAGALSLARFTPGTATADFSILLSDMPGLDADPKSGDPDARAGYAVFGRVVAGMDVVRAIYDAPLSPTAGEGIMRGQMLARPVRIVSARRVPATAIPRPADR